MSHTSTYTVTGMTCAHCESAVATELSELPASPRWTSTWTPVWSRQQ